MSPTKKARALYLGWDVGGWNCDRNKSSRDALVVLDDDLKAVGRSWRGNLRCVINESATSRDFVQRVLALCGAVPTTGPVNVRLAIDCPLGFSRAFAQLVTKGVISEPVEESATNRYLFRYTERFLFGRGLRPLSAVKDMIGSQATKGIQALAKFAPVAESCGVWRSRGGRLMRVLEAYPSGCKASRLVAALRKTVTGECGDTDDERDALTCALIAYLYDARPDDLEPPGASVPVGEGWIWLPKDALQGAPQ
jgi:hypothetical protein